MRARRLTFMLLLYVTADLSNPFMPGAFNFSVEESVEAAAGPSRVRGRAVVSSRFKPNISEPRDRRANLRQERYAAAPTTAFDEWFADLRRAHTPFDEPPSAADDH